MLGERTGSSVGDRPAEVLEAGPRSGERPTTLASSVEAYDSKSALPANVSGAALGGGRSSSWAGLVVRLVEVESRAGDASTTVASSRWKMTGLVRS